MHLDVSRHYFPTDFIKKYIDLLALHKFNTFHWHLTDDQGWRIEIKKYPLLTTVGSKRHETIVDKNFEPYIGDGKPVEGFYTQDEIKDIVKYATERHINVVPEIEMPGHAMAALAAYPQYSCNRTPLDVMTKWGVSDDVYCTKDSTFTFIKNILDEVMKLFPSKYIHIGGDEVPKTRWKRCEICQENIKKNNLKDEHELQSYFIKKIDTYVTSKGRSIIGWDEILEGGLAPNAAVMSWRGEEGGIEASKQKHHVVMSPGTHCYYDHYQGNRTTEPLAIGGFTPIEKVYSYNPIPEQLNQEQASYIMGAQANVWTEYIATPEHVEYMILPRMCALSEVLWTGKSKPGFEDFKIRLKHHFSFLDKWNVYYARSVFDITPSLKVNNGSLEVSLTSNYNDGNIYYALDGLSPDTSMTTYTKDAPILIDGSTTIKAQYFENGEPMGHEYSQDFIIHNGIGKTITSTPEPSKYYNKGGMPKLLDGIAGKTPRYSDEWLGWSGENPFILIDLGEDKLLNSLSLYTLQEENNWIYLPEKIDIEVGTTMKNFISAKTFSKMEIETNYKENSPLDMRFENMILGRYIRILLKCAPKIPAGKPGQGENAWLFLSEISID
jgi:hexosaminidase